MDLSAFGRFTDIVQACFCCRIGVIGLFGLTKIPMNISGKYHNGRRGYNAWNDFANTTRYIISSVKRRGYSLLKQNLYLSYNTQTDLHTTGGWLGGAMVLGKLPVPGSPIIWITVGRCGWGLLGHFYSHLSLLSSFSLSLGDGPI